MESIALKATVVLPILMLQKPSANSKTKEHITCLKRRLITWQNGDLKDLILEGRTIQQRIPKPTTKSSRKYQENLARSFANLIFEGNTKATIRLLTDNPQAGTLRLDDQIEPNRTVRDVLKDKHPPGQPVSPEVIVNHDPPEIHPIVFDQIDASLIRSTALRTTGSAGPS